MLLTKEEDHAQLNRDLIGPPRISRALAVVDEQAGFTPPSWWKGDDYASKSGMAAMMTLKR